MFFSNWKHTLTFRLLSGHFFETRESNDRWILFILIEERRRSLEMTSRGQFPKDTGSQRDFISPVRDDVTRRNRRRGWIGLEGKFWLKDGRVGHRWDFCQRVSRKIARLVKKLLLVQAASFATYIFRTRPSFSYFSLSFPLSPRRHTIRFPRDFLVKTENSSDSSWEGKSTRRENLSLDSSRFFTAFSFPTREILRQRWLVVFAPAWNKWTTREDVYSSRSTNRPRIAILRVFPF